MVRHAMITGGSSGIGKATAKLLAKAGANLTIIARTQTKLEIAKAEIETCRVDSNQQLIALSADVADRVQVQKVVADAIAQLGPPDLLITSAGTVHPGRFQDLPLEVFERAMAINYFGSLYTLKAVLPSMEQQGKGHIVLISSGAGLIGLYGYTAYSPSKFALRGLAESLRGELKSSGVKLSIVYPPDTDTPQLAQENKTKPLATQRMTAIAKTWPAEAVAQTIVDGVRRSSFEITPDLEMSLLVRLHSLLAPVVNWRFDRIAASVHLQNHDD